MHYAPLGSDGKPGSWAELLPVTVIRSITVNGLTPKHDLRISGACPGPCRLYELERFRNPHVHVVQPNSPSSAPAGEGGHLFQKLTRNVNSITRPPGSFVPETVKSL